MGSELPLPFFCVKLLILNFPGGADPLPPSRSMHEQGVSHNEITLLLGLVHGKETAGK